MCVRAEGQRADVAAVLHDLRGPLLTVRSYLDMLAEGGFGALPSEAREAAERAGVAAARAQALAEALVGGSMAVRRVERVELSELLDEVFMALGAEITAAGGIGRGRHAACGDEGSPGVLPRVRESGGERCEVFRHGVAARRRLRLVGR